MEIKSRCLTAALQPRCQVHDEAKMPWCTMAAIPQCSAGECAGGCTEDIAARKVHGGYHIGGEDRSWGIESGMWEERLLIDVIKSDLYLTRSGMMSSDMF